MPRNCAPSAINRILLVGGTTYIPAVRQLVQEMFAKKGNTPDVGCDLAVGVGASIQAAIIQGLISNDSGIILTDVAPFGLGIEVVSEIGRKYMLTYEPLIQPNTTIPYSINKTYSLLRADQKRVEVRLYQDNTGKAKLANDAIDTGITAEITGIPPAPNGSPYPVKVEFSYDINGIAKLKATIPNINRSVELEYAQSSIRMDSQDIADATCRLQELWKQNAKAKEYEGLINKAERFMENIPPQERSPLSDIVMDLKKALLNDNTQQIQIVGDRLVDFLFDLENNMEN